MDRFGFVMFGGYDKLETLKYVDMLTSQIYMLEEAVEKKNKGESFIIPDEPEPFVPKVSALGGFDKDDVENYIDELSQKIKELREKLVSDEI